MASGAKHREQPSINLEASLPDWCAVGWQQTIVCAIFVLMFTWFSYLPIPVSSTWSDVWQGQRFAADSFDSSIADAARVPLSEGMRNFKVAGVGQWLVWNLNKLGGAELLSLAFAAIQTFSAMLWAWLFFRVSRRWWTILLVPAIMLMPWFDNGLTTSIFGSILMASTLLLLTHRRPTLRLLSIALIFLVWANIDQSFVFGWGILLCFLISQAVTCVHDRKSILSDRELRSKLLLLEIAVAVTLINPQGLGLWKSLLWMPDNPLFLSYGGWKPLVISGLTGGSIVGLLAFWIWCSRRAKTIPTELWIVPALGLVMVSLNMSLLSFFALPVLWASISLLPVRPKKQTVVDANQDSQNLPPLKFSLSLVCVLMIWLGFTFSPFAHHVLGGQARTEQQLVGKSSPLSAAEFLAANPTDNSVNRFVFCPRTWSHPILMKCDSVSVFTVPQQHLTPTQANVDYRTIFNGQNGWRKLLDRYTVDTVVVSKAQQARLIHNLRAKPGDWKHVYEDSIAIIWSKGNTK